MYADEALDIKVLISIESVPHVTIPIWILKALRPSEDTSMVHLRCTLLTLFFLQYAKSLHYLLLDLNRCHVLQPFLRWGRFFHTPPLELPAESPIVNLRPEVRSVSAYPRPIHQNFDVLGIRRSLFLLKVMETTIHSHSVLKRRPIVELLDHISRIKS